MFERGGLFRITEILVQFGLRGAHQTAFLMNLMLLATIYWC
jgi:hypothetical protein